MLLGRKCEFICLGKALNTNRLRYFNHLSAQLGQFLGRKTARKYLAKI